MSHPKHCWRLPSPFSHSVMINIWRQWCHNLWNMGCIVYTGGNVHCTQSTKLQKKGPMSEFRTKSPKLLATKDIFMVGTCIICSMWFSMIKDSGLWWALADIADQWPRCSPRDKPALPEGGQFWIFRTLSAFFPTPRPIIRHFPDIYQGAAPMPVYHAAQM